MKKLLTTITAALVALPVLAALDTALTYHDQVLPAQATTLEKDDVLLLGPVGATNGAAVAGAAIDVSAYSGYGLIVGGLGAISDTGDDSTLAIVYGFTTNPATALVTWTQTTATAKFESYEIDFETVKGTNAALYLKATFTNVDGDATPMIGSAVLVRDKARAALQTITGAAVDTVNYKGNGTIVASIGAPVLGATNFVGTVSIQSAAASTGTWAAVSGKTATLTGDSAGATTEIPYEFGAGHRYIRAVFTTTNDASSVGVTLNSYK
jgi:hypothetical protein